MSQLLVFLSNGPRSLKEMSSLAPCDVHHHLQEVGGALNWLMKYNELFTISGKTGEEVVTLKVAHESNFTTEPICAQRKDDKTHGSARAHTFCDNIDESDLDSAVFLRGLPYQATEDDIRQFLGSFTTKLKGDAPIQIISFNKGRRPSGFAKVQLDAPESARDACECLHKRLIFDRYVEVFPFAEKKFKIIAKKTFVANPAAADDGVSSQEDQQTRAAVVQECRDYMESSGRSQLLLSLLGAALSHASRSYLKRTCKGLKQVLGEHPEEFEFSGIKNQQTVRRVSMLTPSESQPSDRKAGDAATNANSGPNNNRPGVIELHRHLCFSNTEVGSALFGKTSSISFDDRPPPETPQLQPPSIPHNVETPTDGVTSVPQAIQTPSDWGTPCPGECETRRVAQQCFNGVQWPALPQSHFPVSVPQDNFSHNLRHFAQGLQAQRAPNSDSHTSAVCLHGLPCYTTEQDVLAFFDMHKVVQHVEDVPNPVLFLQQPMGVPVKSAMVGLQSAAAIHVVLQTLQGKQLHSHTITLTSEFRNTDYPDTNPTQSLATQSKSGFVNVNGWAELIEFLGQAEFQ